MGFYRFNLILGIMLIFMSLSWAASDNFESHFVDFDYGKKISMDFKDVSLNEILKIFSKESGMNFISASDVSDKKITLFLQDIPVEEALEKILNVNDLTYEIAPGSDVFIVKSKSKDKVLITRVFPLKYASVSGSKLNSAGGASGGASAQTGGITSVVKSSLSKEGKLEEDSRTNSFIITDSPEQFPLIEETLAKMDVQVAQILIQVEVLDVSKGLTDKIGVSYGQTPFKFKGAQRSTTFPFDEHLIARKVADPTGIPTWTQTTNGYDFTGMTAALDFLKTQADSRSLARPRLLTLNNQPAHIEISTDEAVGLANTSTSVGSSGASSSTTVERKETGVIVDVTPQANVLTGEILLVVSPKVKEAKNSSIVSGGQIVKDVETRSSNSILRVKNGETVMIGGLLRTVNSTSVSKLPFLGDIPLVGAAFRQKSNDSSERELVIFITPFILDDQFNPGLGNQGKVVLSREVNQP